ncbi:MAG: histidine kinase [Lachnospiraceae bacterium]
MNDNKKQPPSLKRTLILFMVFSWLIPIAILTGFILSSYSKIYLNRTEDLIKNGLKSSTSLLATRLDEDIKLVQKPSYERKWETAWKQYQAGELDEVAYLAVINASLKATYNMNGKFNTYVFYSIESDKPECYASRVGYSYNNYRERIEPQFKDIMEHGDEYVKIKVIDNRIFLIRNLYTIIGNQKYGTLITELNVNELYEGFPMEEIWNVGISIDGQPNILFKDITKKTSDKHAESIFSTLKQQSAKTHNDKVLTATNGDYQGYMYESKQDAYHIAMIYAVDKSVLFAGLNRLYQVIIGMVLLFIPLIICAYYYLRKQIESPVERLVQASKTITAGNIGTVVEGASMPNAEFEYLMHSFNDMSEQVKYLFDSVYNEKLARKDAQIAALQAQINPHFLNNTLEMMNWQARMSDDLTVCKMIEALGTVLDHSMNRDNRKEVPLAEELHCADAYLYIMMMRFGQRMQVEKDIDESILQIKVPQLILQPIIENAILHGIERVKSGTIQLHIYHEEDHIYLDVINTGKDVTQAVIDKIEAAISGQKLPEGSGKHTSIGLRNVSERIRLVYGLEYGLSVAILPGGKFLSRITLPFDRNWQE